MNAVGVPAWANAEPGRSDARLEFIRFRDEIQKQVGIAEFNVYLASKGKPLKENNINVPSTVQRWAASDKTLSSSIASIRPMNVLDLAMSIDKTKKASEVHRAYTDLVKQVIAIVHKRSEDEAKRDTEAEVERIARQLTGNRPGV